MLWKAIIGFFSSLLKNIVLKPLTVVIGTVAMWGFNTIVKSFPGRARWIIKTVTEQAFGSGGTTAAFISDYMKTMTGGVLPIEELVGKPLGGYSDRATRMFVNKFFNDMLSCVMPSPEDIKEDPMRGAEMYLSANVKFQMDAWWLHVMADVFSLGMFKSLKDLPMAISWAFGLGWLSWLVMGTPFQAAIVGPMKKKFNAIYMPEILSTAQLVEATQRGLIDAETFIQRMKESGFSPENSTMIYELSRKELSRSELQRLYDLGLIKDDELLEELRSAGYPDNIAKTLEYLMTSDRLLDLKGKIATEVLELYSEKKLTDTELSRYYAEFGYKEKEIEYVKLLGQLRTDTKPKLTLSEQTSLFRTKIIGYADILEALTSQGYSTGEAIRYVLAHVPQDEWDALIPKQWFDMIFK